MMCYNIAGLCGCSVLVALVVAGALLGPLTPAKADVIVYDNITGHSEWPSGLMLDETAYADDITPAALPGLLTRADVLLANVYYTTDFEGIFTLSIYADAGGPEPLPGALIGSVSTPLVLPHFTPELLVSVPLPDLVVPGTHFWTALAFDHLVPGAGVRWGFEPSVGTRSPITAHQYYSSWLTGGSPEHGMAIRLWAVPEPSAIALVALAGLSLRRR